MEQNRKQEYTVVRNYKDTLFRMVFKDEKELLSLYNALNGTDYENPEELEIVTLENAIYMNVKNDLAFIIDFQMYLYEHQSTDNPNIPLRDLFYVAREYEKLIDKKSLYESRQIKIPTPGFIVFYNGTTPLPERMTYRLSDAYEKRAEEPALELKVQVLNINIGKNAEIMKSCKTLRDYSIYVDKVRTYANECSSLQEAVERAVEECIKNDVLKDFLIKWRLEAINVSIFEYDEEKEMKRIRQSEREIGREEGMQAGRKEGRLAAYADMVRDGLLSVEEAAERVGLTVEEFKRMLE